MQGLCDKARDTHVEELGGTVGRVDVAVDTFVLSCIAVCGVGSGNAGSNMTGLEVGEGQGL